MATWNLQIGYWQILIPTFMLSTGFSIIFPVMSVATLSCVERERMGYAASIYSMTRNTGSAVGISIVSTMLVSGQQIHQSRLAEHFSIFDAWRLGIAPQRMPGAPHFLALPDQLSGRNRDSRWFTAKSSSSPRCSRSTISTGCCSRSGDRDAAPAPPVDVAKQQSRPPPKRRRPSVGTLADSEKLASVTRNVYKTYYWW